MQPWTSTRSHDDLDLVVPCDRCAGAVAALKPLGYRHDASIEPGLPARVVLVAAAGRQVDLHPIEVDAAGDGWLPLGDGSFGAYAAEGLAGAGFIGDRPVACLTADLQIRHHQGYASDEHDLHDLCLLRGLAAGPIPRPRQRSDTR